MGVKTSGGDLHVLRWVLVGDPDPVLERRAGEDAGDQLVTVEAPPAVLAVSISLNVIPSAAAFDPAPFVTRVRNVFVDSATDDALQLIDP